MNEAVSLRAGAAAREPANQAAEQELSGHWRIYLLGLLTIMVVYLSLALAISQVTPFNKGPDEETNLAYIEFLTAKGRLPVTYEEREQIGKDANWPALYHFMVAWLSKAFKIEVEGPPYLKIFWDSFRYQTIDMAVENPWYLRTEDEQWPYHGRILILHLGRWLSILFGLITLALVYPISLELLPNRPGLALMAAALLAFIPIFIFMGSVLNEDTLMAALAALYLWLLIRLVKQPDKLWVYWVIGLVLGLSITIKYTTIILPLEIVLVILVLAWRQGASWRWWLLRVVIAGGCTILASSWWFGWNFWFLNEVEELGLIPGLLRPIFTGGPDMTLSRLGYLFSGGQIGLAELPANRQLGTLPEWIWLTFLSFWGLNIGELNLVPLFPYAYIILSLILAVACWGWRKLWQHDPAVRLWLLLLAFHVGIFFILPLLRFSLSRRLGETAQGRHILIPAAAAVVILIVWGLATAVPQRWQRWLFPLMIVGLIGWTGVHLYRLSTFVPPPLPLRTLPEAANWLPQGVKAQFGDSVELVSYELEAQPEQGQLHVTLAWRSLTSVNENYLLQVSLVNAAGQVVSHWQGYNGQGRLPTLAWDPGDSVFDRVVLPLPSLPAGDYTLRVQLLSLTGPLAVSLQETNDDMGEQSVDLPLATVSLGEPSSLSLSRSINLTGRADPIQIAFDLWRVDGPVEANQKPAYRYPATISILVSPTELDNGELGLQLVDATGQAWSATQVEANIYTFVIGPRWPGGDYRLQMTLYQDGQPIGETTSEPLLTVENWWERYFAVPEIAVPSEANFANQLKFLGYKLPQNQVKAGEAFPLTLYWQALPDRPPQADFIQFNHLLDGSGALWGGYDRLPLEYYSTLLWAPGEVVIDGYAVPVEATAPPGEYYLNVGYYLRVGESAVNLPLVVNGQVTDINSITIGPIQVVAP